MTRLRVAAVLVAAVAVSVATVVAARGWSRGDQAGYAPPAPLVTARLDPASVLFGDVVTARVTVFVDTSSFDPAAIAFAPTFVPFQTLTSTRRTTRLNRRGTVVEFDYRLQCLTSGCLSAFEHEEPGGARVTRPVRFRTATLTAHAADGSAFRRTIRWPDLVMHSRLTAETIASGNPQAEPLYGVPVSYRVDPGVAGWLFVVVSVALVAAGAAVVASALRRLRRPRTLQIPSHLTSAQRALLLARRALAEGHVADGRRALNGLAAALATDGREESAAAAERLAWSASSPSSEGVELLAQNVENGSDAG